MKTKGTLLDLGCDRYFDGRPPSALGLYMAAILILIIGILAKDIRILFMAVGFWLIAWLISVPITDSSIKRKVE